MDNKEIMSNLNEEQIDELLKYAPAFNENNSNNIKNKFYKKISKKNKWKLKGTGFMAAALASVFILSSSLVYAGVKTGVINIDEIYNQAFGNNANYISQYGEIIEGGNESDGIKLNLVSTIKDENQLIVFFTLTDLKGDRLSKSMDLHDSWSLDQGGGGNCRLLNYDKETKTATFQLTSVGASTNKTATLKIKAFLKSLEFKQKIKEDKLDIYSLASNNEVESMTFKEVSKDGHTGGYSDKSKYLNNKELNNLNILKQDKLSTPLSNINWTKISNIGIVDGELHIQTIRQDDSFNNIMGMSFVDDNGNVVFTNEARVGYGKNGGKLNTGLSKYDEFIFENISSLSQIKDLKLQLAVAEYGEYFTGDWEAKFKVPSQAKKINIPVKDTIKLVEEEIKVDEMILSPIGITISYKTNIPFDGSESMINKDSAYVTYKDGTVIDLLFVMKNNDMDKCTYKFTNFSGPVIETENVKSISINGQEILVESK